MYMKKLPIYVLCAIVIVGLLSGSASALAAITVDTAYSPVINPSDFTTSITNKYFSLPVGAKFEYEGETEDGLETIKIEIPGDTKTVMGVKTLVYRDRVWLDGELIEDTKDYLAQDKAGNVWYFGEDVNNYEDGELQDHDGSWLAGVDGALPGIWMKANPVVGETYRQEYYKGEAEDKAKVLSLTETVKVPYGTFMHCLKTLDMNPLEVGTEEYKYYCPQAKQFVLEVNVADGERIELVSILGMGASNMNDGTLAKMQTLISLLKQLIALLRAEAGQ